jgi:hydroxymethylbilane synthase
VLDGSCRTPIAGHARLDGDTVRFRGMIAKTDGSEAWDVSREGPRGDAAKLGEDAGRELSARAGAGFFGGA